MIELVLDNLDVHSFVFDPEAIHTLRDMGMFNAASWDDVGQGGGDPQRLGIGQAALCQGGIGAD